MCVDDPNGDLRRPDEMSSSGRVGVASPALETPARAAASAASAAGMSVAVIMVKP
jgi:hypothetical protein